MPFIPSSFSFLCSADLSIPIKSAVFEILPWFFLSCKNSNISENESVFFKFFDEVESNKKSTKFTHWSYFENLDPYRNYLVAKEYCGLREAQNNNQGTFTNFAQNDQYLYALHTYLMYLKFGFGRANQDACIDIRRGAMDREQGVNLVKLYDGQYPDEFIDLYLDYYQISKKYFDDILDKWTNPKLFKKVNNEIIPLFEIT